MFTYGEKRRGWNGDNVNVNRWNVFDTANYNFLVVDLKMIFLSAQLCTDADKTSRLMGANIVGIVLLMRVWMKAA